MMRLKDGAGGSWRREDGLEDVLEDGLKEMVEGWEWRVAPLDVEWSNRQEANNLARPRPGCAPRPGLMPRPALGTRPGLWPRPGPGHRI